jgi:hypothetical protein
MSKEVKLVLLGKRKPLSLVGIALAVHSFLMVVGIAANLALVACVWIFG